jgi:hypothetical protein
MPPPRLQIKNPLLQYHDAAQRIKHAPHAKYVLRTSIPHLILAYEVGLRIFLFSAFNSFWTAGELDSVILGHPRRPIYFRHRLYPFQFVWVSTWILTVVGVAVVHPNDRSSIPVRNEFQNCYAKSRFYYIKKCLVPPRHGCIFFKIAVRSRLYVWIRDSPNDLTHFGPASPF